MATWNLGDTVTVSDGVVTIRAVTEDSIKYDHCEHGTYVVTVESFNSYAEHGPEKVPNTPVENDRKVGAV